jgi:hypothetical protein
MSFEVTDLLGKPIAKGDTIAAAFRTGNKAELRVGTVMGFGERGNNVTVAVWWYKSSGFGRNSADIDINGAIEADLHRFIRLEA